MVLRDSRAREIQSAIREVLLKQWDPIGVADESAAQDEYDSYVGGVYNLLSKGAAADEVAAHLAKVQRETMGLPASLSGLRTVAVALCALKADSKGDSGG